MTRSSVFLVVVALKSMVWRFSAKEERNLNELIGLVNFGFADGYREFSFNLLGRSLMIFFISSSNPTSRILSASSMIKHWRFFTMKLLVFWRWSSSRPGVATRMLIPEKVEVVFTLHVSLITVTVLNLME